jgi:hypothetical protein
LARTFQRRRNILACGGSLGDLPAVGEVVEYLAHVLERLELIEISSGCLLLARGVLVHGRPSSVAGLTAPEVPVDAGLSPRLP